VTDLEKKLKNARAAIENGITALRRAKQAAPDNHEIQRALNEIGNAEDYIRKALRLLPDNV
jgi:hypothetical protein